MSAPKGGTLHYFEIPVFNVLLLHWCSALAILLVPDSPLFHENIQSRQLIHYFQLILGNILFNAANCISSPKQWLLPPLFYELTLFSLHTWFEQNTLSLYAAHVCFAFKMTKLAKYVGYIFLGNRVFCDICDIKKVRKKCNFLDQKYVFTSMQITVVPCLQYIF